jgi:TM2 domain-containing membrane protein YozV
MPIVVTCPSCSANLKAPDAAAGKRVKCPKCTSTIEVPAAELPLVLEDDFTDEAPPVSARGGAVQRRATEAGAGFPEPPPDWQSNRQTAGILAILLGAFGIHKFILGIQQPAIIMLAVTLVGLFCTLGIGAIAMGVIGIIEGIKYLQMSDAEFYQTYVVDKKAWL